MSISTGEIANIVGGRLLGPDNISIQMLLIDSRKVTSISSSSMFIALSGTRSDGHEFIGDLYNSGIRCFLIAESHKQISQEQAYQDAAFIVCESPIMALHRIARFKRDNFTGKVIAITGSNGKTVVKEWFSDILGDLSSVLRSPRSYNSQTGVPLSVWNLAEQFDYGVFEAGMSMPGEIGKLERIILPDIGVFTNIGDAHQENFIDLDSKIKEKLDLFRNCKTIIYSADDENIDRLIKDSKNLSAKELLTWSLSGKEADLNFTEEVSQLGQTILRVKLPDEELVVTLPYSDRASIQNSAIVITMLHCLNIPVNRIRESVEAIKPVEMRMEQKEGINGCTLIEDYYNSDPAALGIALDYLKSIPAKYKRVIISDFVQQNKDDDNLYGNVVEMIDRSDVDSVICVGEGLMSAKQKFPEETLFFKSTTDLISWLDRVDISNEIILLKGARKFEFERISSILELKIHITKLDINLNNLLWNLNKFRSSLNDGTKTMAMVKAFAYGAGPKEISKWLVNNDIDFLSVAYTDEGVSLRESGISTRIVVMNPDPSSYSTIIRYDLEPEIFSFNTLETFLSEAKRNGLHDYPVHIKLDTGMYRLGFMEHEIENLISKLEGETRIRISSVFSHLAASEDSKYDTETKKQVERYLSITSKMEDELDCSFMKHILNSAGAIRFPEYQFDMVRLGIGLFGTGAELIEHAKSVAFFRSSVSQIKDVKADQGIGYGFTDASKEDRTIAIIPVGYADGLDRRLGRGVGRLFINSEYVEIVGEICMDMCMVDVTGIDVKPGDEVEIFGDNISVSELAERCNTIPYEIITAIPPRVKRVYLFD